jgi:hypothetical protein
MLYDRDRAVEYAIRWAHDRNPQYYNYDNIGGDCTNFVSQCLYAGASVMNYTPVFGWFYISASNKSPSWTGVEFLRDFLVRKTGGPGPFAVEAGMGDMMPGDIIQLSFNGVRFQHSLFVVETGAPENLWDILIASHTDDQLFTSLGTYEWAKIRYLHIVGVNP